MGLFEKDGQNVGPSVSSVERRASGGSGPLFTGDSSEIRGADANDRYVDGATFESSTRTLTLAVRNGVNVDVVIPEGSTPESIIAHFVNSDHIQFIREPNGNVQADIISGSITIDEFTQGLQDLINGKLTGVEAANIEDHRTNSFPNTPTVSAALDGKEGHTLC